MLTVATMCNNKQQSADSRAAQTAAHLMNITQHPRRSCSCLRGGRSFVPSTLLIICCEVLRTEPQVEPGIYPELSDYTKLCEAQLTAREHGLLSERAHGVLVLYGYTTFITLAFSFPSM